METEASRSLEAALAEAEAQYLALLQDLPQLDQKKPGPKRLPQQTQVSKKTTFGTSNRPQIPSKPGVNAVQLLPNLDPVRERTVGGVITKSAKSRTVKPYVGPVTNPSYDMTQKRAPCAVISSPVVRLKPKGRTESAVPPEEKSSKIDSNPTTKTGLEADSKVEKPKESTVSLSAQSFNTSKIGSEPSSIKKTDFARLKSSSLMQKQAGRKRYSEPEEFEIDESQGSVSTAASEYEDFFKVKKEWEQAAKEWETHLPAPKSTQRKPNFPASPAPTKTALGPGAYTANYQLVEKTQPGVSFPTASRTESVPDQSQAALAPNYDSVKWRKPAAIITTPTPKTDLLKKKEIEATEEAEFAALLQLAISSNFVDALKPKVPGGVIDRKEDLMKPDPTAKLGPGLYHVSYGAVEEAIPGAVKYHVDLNELAPRPPERLPGPSSYDPDDMATRGEPRSAIIGQERRGKDPEPDMRRALHINDELLYVQPPQIHIDPEHISVLPPDFSLRIGPGEYDPSHKLVERRDDLGVLKMVEEKEKPQETDMRVLLYPDESGQHPNHLVFQYHEPTVVVPVHVPEKELFPGQWTFYDANVDNKFESVPEVNFARGISQEAFSEYERLKAMEKAHISRVTGAKPVPPPGAYDFEPVSDRAPAFDFGKVVPRDAEPDLDPDRAPEEGDVLVLDPVSKRHIPILVDMSRNLGRPVQESIDLEKEELLIEPNVSAVRPKVPVLVDMHRETGRKEAVIDPDAPELVLDPKPVERRPVVLVNMEKQVGRSVNQSQEEKDAFVQVGDTDPDDLITRMRKPVYVDMGKMTGREDVQTADQSIDVVLPPPVTIFDPTKPRVLGVLPFDRVTGREETKEESIELVLSHPEGVPEVLQSYKSTLPSVKTVAFDRYAAREEAEEKEEQVHVSQYS